MADNQTVNFDVSELKAGLEEIALNLWWSWNPAGRNLFKLINPYLWRESAHNPIGLLQSLDEDDISALADNPNFVREYRFVYADFKNYMESPDRLDGKKPLTIAYFCAEYGLHRSLPIYSGGLGFLAGDILKESSDMGLEMVGVGFMYPQGYIRQFIGSDGWQNGVNEPLIKDIAPVQRVLDESGEHLVVQVPFIEPAVYTAVWRVNVGRVRLYLLDTDIEQNAPWDRQISSHLYTPDINQRLRQQIVLGVGGYRVLERLNEEFSILHLNEGHPAFALFERVRTMIERYGISKEEAISRVKNSSVFTTHTPLQAATDVYSFDMMSRYFQDYWQNLGMDRDEFMGYGLNPDNPDAGFNMTVLGLKMCRQRNGVSKRHKEEILKIWQSVLRDEEESIEAITNGIHLPTWQGDELRSRIDTVLGEHWVDMQDIPDIWNRVDEISDEDIWEIHYRNKIRLINFIRERVRKRWYEDGIEPSVAMAEGVMLDPDILTIGFARRMTQYKRPDLILRDIERLERIVTDAEMPVQIIFAGKAHPADNPGKEIIQRIFKTAQDRRFRGRIAFMEDYGEESAKYLVRGVDVWLNNPKIPMEACGTSGMKASVNGTLHCSTLDGWWPEGYNGKNGWSIGESYSDEVKDAEALYDTIEHRIVPLFYKRDERDLPTEWIEMMREAISSISPQFSARRMMKEYCDRFYEPITKRVREWES